MSHEDKLYARLEALETFLQEIAESTRDYRLQHEAEELIEAGKRLWDNPK